MCRSPIAERLAVAWAAGALAGNPEAAEIEILSAGLEAVGGRDIDPATAAAVTALGGEPTGFRSHVLTPQLAIGADLVLAMTQDHRRSVLELNPRGLRRTFTLLEAGQLMGRAQLDEIQLAPVRTRAVDLGRRLHAARAGRGIRGSHDIADPIGRRRDLHVRTAQTIAGALRPLADVLFSSVRTQLPALTPA